MTKFNKPFRYLSIVIIILTANCVISIDTTASAADVETPVCFADPRLKAAVEDELSIGDPTPTDMLSLVFLNITNMRITDLRGIEYAQNLIILNSNSNFIQDISVLSQLTRLKTLQLNSNNIVDISPLSGLTNLTWLDLKKNDIVTISSLVGLTNLITLELSLNKIEDVSFLAGLTNLTRLGLAGNDLVDISDLAGLTHLTYLQMGSNEIVNISPLSGMTNLTILYLYDNPIVDISALSGLTNLTTLVLFSTEVTGITALSGMKNLTMLNLYSNEITDISALSELTNLTSLDLSENKIADITALAGLENIEELLIFRNSIADITALSNMKRLTILDLDSNFIRDVTPLSGLVNLTSLDLHSNSIEDITPLSGLANLTSLDLRSNEIIDISALVELTNLMSLDLYDNALSCSSYCNDIPRIRRANTFLFDFTYGLIPSSCACESDGKTIYFVDAGVQESQGGTSWSTAFKYLQDALRIAEYGDEIRVAQGVYKPDQGSDISSGDRNATFLLKAGVIVSGGYAGIRKIDPDMRDVDRFETILSGDLVGNDTENFDDQSRAENSIHVVTGDYVDNQTILDGFIITAGYADQSPGEGGGMIIDNKNVSNFSFPKIINCKFVNNYATNGGGLNCSSIALTNCTFTNNYAESYGGGMEAYNATVQGCQFSHNSAGVAGGGVIGRGVMFTECEFYENSAKYAGGIIFEGSLDMTESRINLTSPFARLLDNVTFNNVILENNSADPMEPDVGWLRNMFVNLKGDLNIRNKRLDVISVLFYGEGTINLKSEALLKITGGAGTFPCIIETDINGQGTIKIDAGTQLIIQGDAIVNLSGLKDQIPSPDYGGHIIVGGSLVIQGNATLEGTNVEVKLLDVNTPNDIQYNNITLREASTDFGGEFFVSSNARIMYNNIVSEGDRYLDMDPDPDVQERPRISNNCVTVIIKEGTLSEKGTLLELRAKDYDFNSFGTSGAHLIQDSEGFTEDPSKNWVLESLTLEPDSKLNLTNRQGFEYQDFNEPYPETIYVKELVMGPNSVLNTGLQTLYYQKLLDTEGNELERKSFTKFETLENGAQFMDIPVLGFSLVIINMDDPTEYDVRVHKRLIDPNDEQPKSNNPSIIGQIERIKDDPDIPVDYNSVMEMRTQDPNKESASSIAAKGAFARVGDEEITVEFEYMFRNDPYNEAELIVYLSDDPEVSKNLVPIARIRPPQRGRPGSIGSKRFAVFSGVFPRGSLNFKRGTYIELELRGKGAICWIDNWDPQVSCTAICGDYDTSDYKGINIFDYLTLVAENGLSNPADVGKGCLDLNNDGCVNIDDLQAWEGKGILNRCGDESNALTRELRGSVRLTAYQEATYTEKAEDCTDLLIVGKPFTGKGKEVPESILYCVSPDGNAVDVNFPGSIEDGRLVSDNDGKIYQVSCVNGLIHLDTATAVIEPNKIDQGNTTILVGFHDYDYDFEDEGFLLQDCVFDPRDSRIVYVVPVLVDQGNGPYAAAAKLQIIGDGKFNVLGTYGVDPASDPEQSIQKIEEEGKILLEPDMQHLQEIEIDSEGKYLYVLSRHIYNDNDRILVYDQENGPYPVSVCDVNIVAPTAMVMYSSKDTHEDKLYLASSIASPNNLTPQVHSFIVSADKKQLIHEKSISIDFPQPFYNFGLGIKAAITSMTVNSVDGTLYVTGFSAPRFPEESSVYQFVNTKFPSGPEIFPTSVLAVITPGSESVQAKKINAGSKGLRLPFSILWTEQ